MTSKKVPRVVFNWKENPSTIREAFGLLKSLAKASQKRGGAEVVACPPFVYLAELSKKRAALHGHFSLGAQDIFWENGGAYTGEIGPAMIKPIGATYVIVGHSERRLWLHETDEMVNKKVRAALASGLRVILCVGEPASVRQRGSRAARAYVKNQLKKDLQGLGGRGREAKNLIIAYEPIWAIGTGRNCPPTDACEMAVFIKNEVRAFSRISVLYGGSVDGRTAADYMCYNEINGVLVGGASLHSKEIIKIINKIYGQ